ncbi:hypothetical protein HK405_007306, partial [Cladochytrium tenue]
RLQALLSNVPTLTNESISALLSKSHEELLDSLRSMSISLSELSDYVSSSKSLSVPVYAIASDLDDSRVINSFVSKTRYIPNLHVVTRRCFTFVVGSDSVPVRIFGVGGALPQNVFLSDPGSEDVSMLDMADFVARSTSLSATNELRIVATSLPEHPLLSQIAGYLDADLVIRPSEAGQVMVASSSRSSAAIGQCAPLSLKFESQASAVRQDKNANLSRRDMLLLDLAEKIWKYDSRSDRQCNPTVIELPSIAVKPRQKMLALIPDSNFTGHAAGLETPALSPKAEGDFKKPGPNATTDSLWADAPRTGWSVHETSQAAPVMPKAESATAIPSRASPDAGSFVSTATTDVWAAPVSRWDKESVSDMSSEPDIFIPEAGVSTIWVGNFKDETTIEDLKGFFRGIPYLCIRLSKNCPDRRPCAYVDIFEGDMDRALRLSGERLDGVRLRIEYDPNRINKLRRAIRESREDLETFYNTAATATNQDRRRVGRKTSSQFSSHSDEAHLYQNAPGSSAATVTASDNQFAHQGALKTVAPAGWTQRGGSSSWESPPRPSTTFTMGARWDRASGTAEPPTSVGLTAARHGQVTAAPSELPATMSQAFLSGGTFPVAPSDDLHYGSMARLVAPAAEWVPSGQVVAEQMHRERATRAWFSLASGQEGVAQQLAGVPQARPRTPPAPADSARAILQASRGHSDVALPAVRKRGSDASLHGATGGQLWSPPAEAVPYHELEAHHRRGLEAMAALDAAAPLHRHHRSFDDAQQHSHHHHNVQHYHQMLQLGGRLQHQYQHQQLRAAQQLSTQAGPRELPDPAAFGDLQLAVASATARKARPLLGVAAVQRLSSAPAAPAAASAADSLHPAPASGKTEAYGTIGGRRDVAAVGAAAWPGDVGLTRWPSTPLMPAQQTLAPPASGLRGGWGF